MSFGIIRDHQGHISVQSELGEGTTFIINVPLHQVEEGKPARESTHGQAPEEPKVETAGGGY